ncbi:hypothetical protein A6R68_09229, partial [Neotoma lepida]
MLKPHAPKLIPALLESLSVLEPQILNYLSLRATEQEKVVMDSARLTAAKSSPMMETVNMGGCASVIVSLTTQCPQDLTPHSGKLMSALLSGLTDRNSVIQKSCAFAMGHLVRTSRDSSTEKLLQKLNGWYMEKEELEKSVPNQPTTHEILQAVLKECCKENLKYKIVAISCAADVLKATKEDRFQEFSDIVIPLIKKNSLESMGVRSTKAEDESDKERELQLESLLGAFESLGKAWPRNPETQRCYRQELCKLMCERLRLSTWKVQLECLLLAVMAYDRYVAICNPLRYPIIMNRQVCVQMATVSWVTGCLTALLETSFALQIPLCGNVIDHFTYFMVVVFSREAETSPDPRPGDCNFPAVVIVNRCGRQQPMPVLMMMFNEHLLFAHRVQASGWSTIPPTTILNPLCFLTRFCTDEGDVGGYQSVVLKGRETTFPSNPSPIPTSSKSRSPWYIQASLLLMRGGLSYSEKQRILKTLETLQGLEWKAVEKGKATRQKCTMQGVNLSSANGQALG